MQGNKRLHFTSSDIEMPEKQSLLNTLKNKPMFVSRFTSILGAMKIG